MGICMCYGVNTCLVLIMRLSGRIMGSGNRARICFSLCFFVPGFNAYHVEWLSVLSII